MGIDELQQMVLSATGREIHGTLADGQRCVINFDGEIWNGWVYEGDAIMYKDHWHGESIDEMIVNGRRKGVDVLSVDYTA